MRFRFLLCLALVPMALSSARLAFAEEDVRAAAEPSRSPAPSAATTSASASFAAAEHPFLLWTKDEAAAIRRRIETEPWAKAQYEAMLKEKGNGQTFRNLFRYQVMGDQSVVDAEKKYLVSLIGNNPRQFMGDTGGGRHYDQYLSVLRYDVLYDRLRCPLALRLISAAPVVIAAPPRASSAAERAC